MDAVATAAARSLMTERVDRRRRMVLTFQKRRLSNKCLQIIYQEEKRQLIEFRRRSDG